MVGSGAEEGAERPERAEGPQRRPGAESRRKAPASRIGRSGPFCLSRVDNGAGMGAVAARWACAALCIEFRDGCRVWSKIVLRSVCGAVVRRGGLGDKRPGLSTPALCVVSPVVDDGGHVLT